MSGIFGFSFRREPAAELQLTLEGLSYWNQLYGSAAADSTLIGPSGIGCHVEHFSDRFPYTGPIHQEQGTYAVVDALLYNREELLSLLNLPSSALISDEALLLQLIRQKGFDSLSAVNGDFAGAIYDPATGSWKLFRDHLGVRPLYVYHDDRIFAFSTDIRGIASIPGADLRPNELQLFTSFMNCNPLTMQQTDFASIRCALPGAWTTITRDAGGFALEERPYWKLRSRKLRLSSVEEYEHRLRQLVADAVKRRLDAVPGLIGAELSGGLDSSVIDILINRAGRKAVYYSWSHDPEDLPMDRELDERSVIRDICEQEDIQCRYLRFSDGRSTTDTYERVIPPFVNTFELSYGSRWMHEQGARAVFTGHGGDEGVSHRGGRYELLCNGELLPYLRLHYRDLEGISLRPLKAVYAACLGGVRDHRRHRSTIRKEELVSPVLCSSFTARMASPFREEPFHFFTKPYRYVLQGGTRDRLENAAFQGASAGVRYLFPFVDHRVMDFAVSIPRHLYVSDKETRVIYRNAFADLMPESLRRVSYKAMVSLRHIGSRNMDHDAYVINREYIVNKLDPEYWRGILDLEAIARREQPQDPASDEARAFRSDTHMLYRCILIQNTAKLAKDWKTIHDRTDLL